VRRGSLARRWQLPLQVGEYAAATGVIGRPALSATACFLCKVQEARPVARSRPSTSCLGPLITRVRVAPLLFAARLMRKLGRDDKRGESAPASAGLRLSLLFGLAPRSGACCADVQFWISSCGPGRVPALFAAMRKQNLVEAVSGSTSTEWGQLALFLSSIWMDCTLPILTSVCWIPLLHRDRCPGLISVHGFGATGSRVHLPFVDLVHIHRCSLAFGFR